MPMPIRLQTQQALPLSYLQSWQPQARKHCIFKKDGQPLCTSQTEVVGKGNVMSIEDDIIRNLLNGFLVCAFHISPFKKTTPHRDSFCAVNTILIRPITALTVREEIKHLGDSSRATLIELEGCCYVDRGICLLLQASKSSWQNELQIP